ncbi:unnamed protein product [Owenia fusiformis]|uniref:Uncharacterized protein n=1 Tax=Owenia fusiformis TaxID=6347 RepID=A0A8S4N2Z7_OWEFU|nr:unnamed protein product [Owenia fusiformis]
MKLVYIIIVSFISCTCTNSGNCPGRCKYHYGEPGKVTSCECYSTDKMYVKISELLQCIPNTVIQLELSEYNFGTISNGSFQHLPKLGILNMTECNITVLERNGFNGLKDLYQLVISDVHKNSPGFVLSEPR